MSKPSDWRSEKRFMRALVMHEVKQPLQLEERGELQPGEGEAIVALRAAALNRRDYWITQGMYPGIKTPVVLGSDGAGVVTRVGDGAPAEWLEREAIINPGWEWGDDEAAQGAGFRILGLPDDGTFAEQVAVPVEYLHPKPRHLNWPQAAALPLAGVTAYRAVFTQGRLQAGETVLISGVGGGVATFALQFAKAAGARVLVTSSSPEKIDKAVALGAAGGLNYTEEGWHKQARDEFGSPNLIVDSAGGAGYADLIDLAAPGGRIVNYGATAGPPKFDLFKVFWKQVHLIGSTMGSPADFQNMLDFVDRHQIMPAVEAVVPLGEGASAIAGMKHSRQFGKVVLEIAP